MILLGQNIVERLRPIVNSKNWDYCVCWKMSEDQRFLEWMFCCCAGAADGVHACEEELLFSVSSSASPPCRDVFFQHPRTKPCDLLSQLPTSIILDSGMHAQSFLSNQAKWLNFSQLLESNNVSGEIIGTRVLIPQPLGLIELFTAKLVPEDQQVIDFVTGQCSMHMEHQAAMMMNSSSGIPADDAYNGENDQMDDPRHLFSPSSHLTSLPMSFLPQMSSSSMLMPNTNELSEFRIESGLDHHEIDVVMVQKQMMMDNKEGNDDDPVKGLCGSSYNRQENGQSHSISDSDQNEDEDDGKYRRNGKGHQSKNLVAERKRRKKLNERLYALRALVPNISKLDRASILGDAIEYVMELQKQATDLQNELELNSEDDDEAAEAAAGGRKRNHLSRTEDRNGIPRVPKSEPEKYLVAESEKTDDKVQQMEPQVEVAQLDGNEFLVKVFCEHKSGGFVRLMEALNSLGLEVTNVNTTRHTCLVSNIFKVERRDCETVQADDVRESLLELTRNPAGRGWPAAEMGREGLESTDQGGMDHQQPRRLNHHLQLHAHHLHRLHN